MEGSTEEYGVQNINTTWYIPRMKSRITKKIPVDCAGRKSWKQLFFELKDNESILLTFADGARFSQGIHKYSDKHRIVLKEVKCICEKLRRCTKVKI